MPADFDIILKNTFLPKIGLTANATIISDFTKKTHYREITNKYIVPYLASGKNRTISANEGIIAYIYICKNECVFIWLNMVIYFCQSAYYSFVTLFSHAIIA